jgi:hypothetical protein
MKILLGWLSSGITGGLVRQLDETLRDGRYSAQLPGQEESRIFPTSSGLFSLADGPNNLYPVQGKKERYGGIMRGARRKRVLRDALRIPAFAIEWVRNKRRKSQWKK